MSDIKVELISSGIQELLKSPEIKSICEDVAKSLIQERDPNHEYQIESRTGALRTKVNIISDSGKTYGNNNKNRGIWE